MISNGDNRNLVKADTLQFCSSSSLTVHLTVQCHGRRVERLDDSRLVKVIMEKMEDCGSVSWQGEYDQLLRK